MDELPIADNLLERHFGPESPNESLVADITAFRRGRAGARFSWVIPEYRSERMAHRRLFPKPGSDYLSPPEVIARLRSHFKHVRIDPEQGEAHVNKMVDQLTRMQLLTPPPATPEEIEHLRGLRGEAVFVMFADNPAFGEAYLTTTIIPGEPLFFGFSSVNHEEAACGLLERCALLLDYRITEE
jgi:hypothetical protein